MFLTLHAAVGALIGEEVSSPTLAFVLGFIFHFVLDLIPHGDEDLVKGYQDGARIKRMVSVATVDAIVMAILFFIFYSQDFFFQPKVVIWGITGSIFPDFLIGVHEITKIKILDKFHDLHYFAHNFFFERFHLSFTKGLIVQLSIIIAIGFFLLSYFFV
jgi:hypothetical protein